MGLTASERGARVGTGGRRDALRQTGIPDGGAVRALVAQRNKPETTVNLHTAFAMKALPTLIPRLGEIGSMFS